MNKQIDPLDALASQAEQIGIGEGATVEGSQEAQQRPEMTNAQAIAGAIGAGREAFCFFTKLESPRRVLTDGRVQELAALADPVCAKYGWDVGAMIGDFGPELALAVGVFGVVLELRQAVALEVAEKAPKKKQDSTNVYEFKSADDGQ